MVPLKLRPTYCPVKKVNIDCKQIRLVEGAAITEVERNTAAACVGFRTIKSYK
jgi:hypothetical protein